MGGGTLGGVHDRDRSRRLRTESEAARAAESRDDPHAANEAWRRYRLIQDAGRDPDDLLREGIELSRVALRLAGAAAEPRID